MIKQSLIILMIVGLIFGGLFGYKYYQINQQEQQIQTVLPTVVAITKVKTETWESGLDLVGTLVAIAGVEVSNEIAGKVSAIHFKSGQTVKKGQLLLELDSKTDRAELKGLLAEQQLAKMRFQRATQLIQEKFTSQSEYDQNKAETDGANAAVESKQSLINKKQIRAPFSGELGIREVNLGQYLAAGSVIVSLQNRHPIYVDMTVPERQLGQLSVGQKVQLSVQAYHDKNFEGKVTVINPSINFDTRSIKVRAKIDNNDYLLRPGMFAKVQLISDKQIQVLTLPDTAISYNPYGNSVFVVKSDQQKSTVQSRQIETGKSKNGRIEIISGLAEGEQVVSAGQIKLRNDMEVVADKKPAPGERELKQ